MNRQSNKNRIFLILLIAMVLSLVEAMCYISIRLLHWQPSGAIDAFYSERIATKIPQIDFSLGRHQEWNREKAHPYFGFHMDTDYAAGKLPPGVSIPVNNHGFFDSHDYPVTHSKDRFLIGLFGGSFAQQLAAILQGSKQLQRLAEIVPALKGKQIVLVNMALGAGKEPQQFFIYSFFAPMFDFVLGVDGFNEIDAFPPAQFPMEFPYYSQVLFSHSGQYFAQIARVSVLRERQKREQELMAKMVFLNKSNFIYLGDYLLNWYWSNQMFKLVQEVNSDAHGKSEFYGRGFNMDEKQEMGVEIWSRYTRQMYALTRLYHQSALFLLQPNQYFGAKQLTEEEKRVAFSKEYERDKRTFKGYQKLVREAQALEKDQIPASTQLIDVFAEHSKETLYRDICCHLNDRGYQIVGDKLVKLIADRLKKN